MMIMLEPKNDKTDDGMLDREQILSSQGDKS